MRVLGVAGRYGKERGEVGIPGVSISREPSDTIAAEGGLRDL